MRIGIISDIHSEFRGVTFPALNQDVDVLVLAGDIGVGSYGAWAAYDEYADRVGEFIYVAGNHEYYGRDMQAVQDELRKFADQDHAKKFHFLEQQSVVIGHTRFIGATAWTDFDLYGNAPLAMIDAARGLNDYRMIRYGNGIITPEDTRQIALQTKQYIFDQLLQSSILSDVNDTVVITHHAPTGRSVHPRYMSDPSLNPCYANRWGDKILDLEPDAQPRLWIHGHTHDPFDYMVGETRVIANPCGYPGERNPRPEVLVTELD